MTISSSGVNSVFSEGSLASYLATLGQSNPISSPSAPSVGQALILSSSLPPIPAKVVDKVKANKFIEFKELLTDNILLSQRVNELGLGINNNAALVPKISMREIQDPLSWIFCYLSFMKLANGAVSTVLLSEISSLFWVIYTMLQW